MTAPLSKDLRDRLIAAVEGGQSRREAAKRFGIAPSTAIKWMERWRREGHAKPRPMGGDRHSHRMEAHAAEILAMVEATPDITLAEIAAHLDQAHGMKPSRSSVWRLLDRHGLTFKKSKRVRLDSRHRSTLGVSNASAIAAGNYCHSLTMYTMHPQPGNCPEKIRRPRDCSSYRAPGGLTGMSFSASTDTALCSAPDGRGAVRFSIQVAMSRNTTSACRSRISMW